jgi:hypothetical protein
MEDFLRGRRIDSGLSCKIERKSCQRSEPQKYVYSCTNSNDYRSKP